MSIIKFSLDLYPTLKGTAGPEILEEPEAEAPIVRVVTLGWKDILPPLGLPVILLSFPSICPVSPPNMAVLFPLLSYLSQLSTSILHSCHIWLLHISHSDHLLPSSRLLLPIYLPTFPFGFPTLGSSQSSEQSLSLPPPSQGSSSTQISD